MLTWQLALATHSRRTQFRAVADIASVHSWCRLCIRVADLQVRDGIYTAMVSPHAQNDLNFKAPGEDVGNCYHTHPPYKKQQRQYYEY